MRIIESLDILPFNGWSQVTCTVQREEDCYNTQNMPPALSAVDIAQTKEGICFQSLDGTLELM